MLEVDSKYWMYAARVLAGEASEEEEDILDRWCSDDPERRDWLEEVRATWEMTAQEQSACDVEGAIEAVRRRLGWAQTS